MKAIESIKTLFNKCFRVFLTRKTETLYDRFLLFIHEANRDGVIGNGRYVISIAKAENSGILLSLVIDDGLRNYELHFVGVPAELQWAKDIFVLNCAIGCRINDLLRLCGISRQVRMYCSEIGDNVYRPLYEVATSKLARKTHIDMLNKVQINYYAAGLHRQK